MRLEEMIFYKSPAGRVYEFTSRIVGPMPFYIRDQLHMIILGRYYGT
jgi:hypothetical protein